MKKTKVPHLCGGTFFALVLQARKAGGSAREKLNGSNKNLTAANVFAGLTKVLIGESILTKGDTLKKCASLYKTCQTCSGINVPFTDTATVSSFDSSIKAKNPAIYERMTEFINTYLNQDKCEWLVRALIDTIQHDTCIPGTTLFNVDYAQTITKGNLDKIKGVVLQPFLLSVLHYVVMNAPDSESGRSTFERWFSQSSKRAEWKYCGKAGDSIHRINVELIDYDPGAGNKDVEENGGEKQEDSDADGITGVPLVVHQVAPDLSNLLNSKIYTVDDDLFEDDENGTASENTKDDTYVLAAYEKYKWMRLPGEGEYPMEDFYVCNNLGTASAVYPLRIKGNVIEQATLEKIRTFDKRAEIWCALIIGACGFGKTLMLQHLFMEAVNKRKETGMFPVFAELRNFSSEHDSLLSFILETIQDYDENFSEEIFVSYLSKGRVQILLDGLDEMDPQETNHFQKELAKLRQRYPNNQVAISSRQCEAISGIRNCVHFYLHPLSEEQADELIDRLLVGTPAEGAKDIVKEFTKPGIGYVMNSGFIATNPMLLTIIVRKYEQIRNFNGSKVKFYEMLYKALISGHDAEKQAYGRFFHSVSDGTEFTYLFREFCAISFLDGVFEFNDRSFEKYFNKLQEKKHLANPEKCKLSAFQKDVCATACMMYEQDSGIYYIDPGFQDYFFAEYFYQQDDADRNRTIGKTFCNGKIASIQNANVLNMFYEIADEKTEVYILLPYLEVIFKGKSDDEAFLRFLTYGYGKIRYLLLDRKKIDSFSKILSKKENIDLVPDVNFVNNITIEFMCNFLYLSHMLVIGSYDEVLQVDESTTHFITGFYEVVRDSEDAKKHTWLRMMKCEIAYLDDNQYFQDLEFVPFPVTDEQTGHAVVFGYVYEVTPLLLLDKPEQLQRFIRVCKSCTVWKTYVKIREYYNSLVEKQKANEYR